MRHAAPIDEVALDRAATVTWLERIGRDLRLDLASHLDAYEADRSWLDEVERAVASEPMFRTKRWSSPLALGLYRVTLGVIVRALRPRVFVETGVLHGITTSALLAALRETGTGRLVQRNGQYRQQNGAGGQQRRHEPVAGAQAFPVVE